MSVEVRDGRTELSSFAERTDAQARVRASLGSTVLQDARLLLIAVWLGAAVCFSFVVAPSAFAVLPARELAGNMVTRTLSIVNVAGFIVSLVLLASAFVGRGRASRRAWLVELTALALVALTTFIGHWLINARLLALRHAMGRPIDAVAANDPVRVAFDSLHGYSVAALGIGMLAAAVALLAIARRRSN
jgi:Domain of unknown function (DUF4149)